MYVIFLFCLVKQATEQKYAILKRIDLKKCAPHSQKWSKAWSFLLR